VPVGTGDDPNILEDIIIPVTPEAGGELVMVFVSGDAVFPMDDDGNS